MQEKDAVIVVLSLSVGGLIAYALFKKRNITSPTPTPPAPTPTPTPTPTPIPSQTIITLGEGERDGPLLVQTAYSDHIDGINYIEYPVGYQKNVSLYTGQSVSDGCIETLTLIDIVRLQTSPLTYAGIFSKVVDTTRPCPVCLSENTHIDTPDGEIPVQSIQEGNVIWTLDIYGSKQTAKVVNVIKTRVKNHKMVHIRLDDNREVYASPNHPLSDGRLVKDIKSGDIIDNSTVIITEIVPYKGDYTYDIQPSGETGTYISDGIPLKTTLNFHTK